MKAWAFHNPVRVVFASAGLDRLAEFAPYERVALVTTAGFTRRGVTARVEAALGPRLAAVWDAVQPNPDMAGVRAAAAAVRDRAPDGIVALGGGSVIDTAKVLARELAAPAPALPIVAIPTTAGTGAEVTPFATIWDFEERKKHSVMGDDLFPRVALLDPELSVSSPAVVTASSGLDAISHALESTWNHNAGPASLALSARSLALSLPALKALHRNPTDLDARAAMLTASTLAGIAIAQTRTALAHSISYPLTAHWGLDHGVACSFALVELLRFNAEVDDGRLEALARMVGVDGVPALADQLAALLHELGVADALRAHGATLARLTALSGEMFTPGRADNNLRDATVEDVEGLLAGACRRLEIAGA